MTSIYRPLERLCPNCATSLEGARAGKRFCSSLCRSRHYLLSLRRRVEDLERENAELRSRLKGEPKIT